MNIITHNVAVPKSYTLSEKEIEAFHTVATVLSDMSEVFTQSRKISDLEDVSCTLEDIVFFKNTTIMPKVSGRYIINCTE